jgi:TetR/AcrR family transcriptional repressor of nem operon
VKVLVGCPTKSAGVLESSDTRSKIVDSARSLFARNGFERTSLTAVARDAGVNGGSIYHFFPTKYRLLCAVLQSYLDGLKPVIMQPAFASASDPIERVFAVLDGYRKRVLDSQFRYRCPIGALALEVADQDDEVRALIAQNFANWRVEIRRCFEAAKDRLSTDADLDQLASLVLTVMEGSVMQCAAEQSIEPFDRSIAQLRKHVTSLSRAAGREATQRERRRSRG